MSLAELERDGKLGPLRSTPEELDRLFGAAKRRLEDSVATNTSLDAWYRRG